MPQQVINANLQEEAALPAASPCRSLMVLGGSNCQLHALQRAKQRGCRTVLADYTKNPPGKACADRHLLISTFDAEACIRAAKEEAVDGVLCVGTDQPVLTAARVAKACHLPSPLSVETAKAVTNKRLMKRVFREAGIRTPAYCFLRKDGTFLDSDERECACFLRPPYVIKPLDSQGQRGVFKVRSMDELLQCLSETLSFSREELCLVEEFYESDEITVSAWLADDVFYPLSVTDRIHYPDERHIGVCTGHRYPSIHIDRYEDILEISRKCASAFRIHNGPFYFQILCGSDGILAGEIACRVGGAFEDVTIPVLTGFPLMDAAMDLSLGLSCAPPARVTKAQLQNRRAFVLLLFCKPGIVSSITPREELLSLPFVADCGYNYGVGDRIPVMQNATARFGHAVLFGEHDTIHAHVRTFFDALHVYNPDGDDLLERDVVARRYLEG